MDAVILAAGVGSRLRPITDSVPKCLVPVLGRTILSYQIEALLSAGISRILVVAGYRADQVKESLQNYPNVEIIENTDYTTTNNMYSLFLAFPKLGDTFILMNGDVVLDPEIILEIINHRGNALIAAQRDVYDPESMKIVMQGDRIVEIAKTIPIHRAYGCSVDLYKFGPAAKNALVTCIDGFIQTGNLTQWTEVAIQQVLETVPFTVMEIGTWRWMEIDNHEDLARAERIFSGEG